MGIVFQGGLNISNTRYMFTNPVVKSCNNIKVCTWFDHINYDFKQKFLA